MSPLNWVKQDVDTYKAGGAMPFSPSFVFSPDGQTVGFVDSSTNIIYLSTDSGAHWDKYLGLVNVGFVVGLEALTSTSIMYLYGGGGYQRHDKDTGTTTLIASTPGFYARATIATSGTGQYVSYTTGGYIFSISNDYGSTWTVVFNIVNGFEKFMVQTMDSTGQYMAISIINEYVVPIGNLNHGHNCVHISSDYGVSWTKVLDLTDTDIPSFYMAERFAFAANYNNSTMCVAYTTGTYPHLTAWCHLTHDSGASWHKTAIKTDGGVEYGQYYMDYTGQYIAWVNSSGVLSTSQDYGETWTLAYLAATIRLISIRPTGHEVWGSFANYTAGITTDWFSSWTSINPFTGQSMVGDWLTKASADGKKFLVAEYNQGYTYIGNGNNVWEKANIAEGRSTSVESCAISGNGQYMLVGEYGGRLFLSTTEGVAWSEIRPSGIDGNLSWYSTAINYTGQYMLAGEYGSDNLYFSNDYGVTWTLKDGGNGYAEMSCINDGGSVLVAGGWGGLFISTDFGSSWTHAPIIDWWYFEGVSCSALGDIIYLITQRYILRSLDYGLSWEEIINSGNGSNTSITCSDNGEIVLSTNTYTGLYLSTDNGTTWTLELPITYDVSSDSTGTRIICGQYNGYVYMSGAAAPINLDDKYAKLGHNHPYAPPADYMINGHTIYPLDIRPTGSYYSSAGEIGVGNGIPHSLRLANGGVLTLTVRGGLVTYIG